jgi:transcriptional regulator with XRE-family HTH domain
VEHLVKPWLERVAANVRRLRLRKGLTQEALAERAGIEARYVQSLERARANLTLAVLCGIAEALGVDPRALLKPARLQPARIGRPKRKGRVPQRNG